jgi:hypothetical protein
MQTNQNLGSHDERYWQILQYNIDWLRFSETKATVILTVYGILLTITYTNAGPVFQAIKDSTFLFWTTLIYGALTILSVVCAFLSINPSLKNINPNSILYFGHISKKFQDASTYKTHAKSVLDNDDTYTDQIAEQIYINSTIAWKKYRLVTWSLRLFFGSLLTVIISMIVYLLKELP